MHSKTACTTQKQHALKNSMHSKEKVSVEHRKVTQREREKQSNMDHCFYAIASTNHLICAIGVLGRGAKHRTILHTKSQSVAQ